MIYLPLTIVELLFATMTICNTQVVVQNAPISDRLFRSYEVIMEPHSGWHPMRGRESDAVKGYGGDREPQTKVNGVRVAIVVFALAIIGITIYFPARRELAKFLVLAIWDMLCNIANTCSDFIEYVKHQRST